MIHCIFVCLRRRHRQQRCSHATIAAVSSAFDCVLSFITLTSSAPRSTLRLTTDMEYAPASASSTPIARAAPPAPNKTITLAARVNDSVERHQKSFSISVLAEFADMPQSLGTTNGAALLG